MLLQAPGMNVYTDIHSVKILSKELVVAVVAITMMIIIATVIMTTEVEVLFGIPTNVAFIQTSPRKKGDQRVPPAYGLTMKER